VIYQRKYQGDADLNRMIDLANATQAENIHFIDLPYRLSSWALDEPQNIGLWVDGRGQLVAWVVMQSPFWMIDYVIRPDSLRSGFRPILAWVEGRARSLLNTSYGHSCWYMNVLPRQTERMQALEQVGFIPQADLPNEAWSSVWMELDRTKPIPTQRLPEDFTIRPMAGSGEVSAYVELHQAVFETKNMTVDWRNRTLLQPTYRPALDLVVVAPDRKLVAFCIGWLGRDLEGRTIGQIEPLGCQAEYRKFGLGRQVLCETLRRLYQHGAENIYVETDDFRSAAFHLYQGIGFEVVHQVLVYRKDFGDEPV
jgi:ribosomal protein S18 acetylase RimI-like enzyme